MRSTFDILQDLSEAWENLTSVEKQELTETVAGKTQRSLFTAIMTNFDSAVGATEAALNSEGSALEENNKRMDSLNGRITQLDSAWQELARTTVDSDFLKNIVSATTEIVKLTTKLGGLIPVLTAVAGLLIAAKAGSITKGFTDFISKAKQVISTIDLLGGGLKGLQLYLMGVKTAEEATAAASMKLATAFGLVMTAISIVVQVYNYFKQSAEEAKQAALDEADAHLSNASSIEEEIKTQEDEIESLKNEIEELEKLADTDDGTEAKIKNKKEEIKQRELNIAKMQEERKEELQSAYNSLIGTGTNDTSGQIHVALGGVKFGVNWGEYYEYIDKYNNAVEGLTDNTGAYKRAAEGVINSLAKQREGMNANSREYKTITEAISRMNKELNKQSDEYEEDSKTAEIYYQSILNGVENVTQADKDWLQEFFDLTDEQMEQLERGIDVFEEVESATEDVSGATDELTQNIEEEKSAFDTLSSKLDEVQSAFNTLKGAVDEYNSDGYLSVDTLQSLLSLSDEYLSALSMENGQLVLNTTALDQKTDSLIASRVEQLRAAAVSDIYNLSINNTDAMSQGAKTAIENLGTQAVNMGNDFASAVPDINAFTAAILNAKEVAGAETNVEGYEEKRDAILGYYQGLYNEITSLGATTTGRGGYGSGSSHKYYGKTSGSGSSGKSGSSSSKSSADTYKAEVDYLYAWKNALDNTKDAVDKLNDALDDTDNFNEQEQILRQLIDATNAQVRATQDLKEVQSSSIRDMINQLNQYGFAIDYNAEKNELYIQNMAHLADFTGDTAKTVEKLIDKIQDLNDDNRSLDASIRDLTSDVKDYYEQLADIPEQKLEKFKELMEDFQQSRLDQVQNQIDDIEHAKENDPRLKALEAQIEALENQNDELDKQKELDEKILAVEEAKEKLANANKQRNIQIYREGQG